MENDKQFVIVRTYSAGVHAGYLEKFDGKSISLSKSIRIWYWSGAASLSQLAMEGVKNPDACKFAMPVSMIVLTEAIEVITATEEARKNIQAVKSWKA